jgi:hypothetical protein
MLKHLVVIGLAVCLTACKDRNPQLADQEMLPLCGTQFTPEQYAEKVSASRQGQSRAAEFLAVHNYSKGDAAGEYYWRLEYLRSRANRDGQWFRSQRPFLAGPSRWGGAKNCELAREVAREIIREYAKAPNERDETDAGTLELAYLYLGFNGMCDSQAQPWPGTAGSTQAERDAATQYNLTNDYMCGEKLYRAKKP